MGRRCSGQVALRVSATFICAFNCLLMLLTLASIHPAILKVAISFPSAVRVVQMPLEVGLLSLFLLSIAALYTHGTTNHGHQEQPSVIHP